MPECDDRVALLEKLVGDQLELVPFADRLLQGANRCLLSLMPPGARHAGPVVFPDEVIGPRIGRPFEITLAEALVALLRSVNLAGHAALPSSAEIPTKATVSPGVTSGNPCVMVGPAGHGGPCGAA